MQIERHQIRGYAAIKSGPSLCGKAILQLPYRLLQLMRESCCSRHVPRRVRLTFSRFFFFLLSNANTVIRKHDGRPCWLYAFPSAFAKVSLFTPQDGNKRGLWLWLSSSSTRRNEVSVTVSFKQKKVSVILSSKKISVIYKSAESGAKLEPKRSWCTTEQYILNIGEF